MLLFRAALLSLFLQLTFSLRTTILLNLKDVSTQSISVDWSTTSGDTGDFLATISPTDEGENKHPEKIHASTASWDGLVPGKNYSIVVVAVSRSGDRSTPATLDVTTEPLPPYHVRISKFVNPVLTEYSVTGNKTMMFPVYGAVVMWEGPDVGHLDGYHVVVNPPHGSVRIPVALNAGKPVPQPLKKRRIIWDLVPGIEYVFTVRSKSNNRLSDPASSSERMPSETPSAIDISNLTPTSVSLSWDEPHRGLLDGYIVEVSPPEGEVVEPLVATEKRRTIKSLTPGSKYKIDVYSTSFDVLSFQSRTVHIKTPPLTPLGPVLASDITINSVIIKWQWPGKNVHYYEVIFYPTKRDYGRLRHRIGDPEVQLNFLEPDTEYSLILYSVANKVYSKPLYAKVRTASLTTAGPDTTTTTTSGLKNNPATAPNDVPIQKFFTTQPIEKTTGQDVETSVKSKTDFYKDEVTIAEASTKPIPPLVVVNKNDKTTTEKTSDKLEEGAKTTPRPVVVVEIKSTTRPIKTENTKKTTIPVTPVSNNFRELEEEKLPTTIKQVHEVKTIATTTQGSLELTTTKESKIDMTTKKESDVTTDEDKVERWGATYDDNEERYFWAIITTAEPDIIDVETEFTKSEQFTEVERTTSKSTTSKPTSTKSNTLETNSTKLNTLEPTSTTPNALEPSSTKSNTLEPTSTKINTLEPTSTKPNSLESSSTKSNTLEPTSTKINTLEPTSTKSNDLKSTSTNSINLESMSTSLNTLEPTSTKSIVLESTFTKTSTLRPTFTESATLKANSTKSNTLKSTSTNVNTLKPISTKSTTLEPIVTRSSTLESTSTELTFSRSTSTGSTTLKQNSTRPTTLAGLTKSITSELFTTKSTTLGSYSREFTTSELTARQSTVFGRATSAVTLNKIQDRDGNQTTTITSQSTTSIMTKETNPFTTTISDEVTTQVQSGTSPPLVIDPNEVPLVSTTVVNRASRASLPTTTLSPGKSPTTTSESEITIHTGGNAVPIKGGITTICKPDNITVLVNKSVIGEYEKKYGPLHLNAQDNELCRGVEEGSYYRYTIAPDILDCGTRLELNETHVNFTNTVSNSKYRTSWLRSLADSSGTVIMGHRLKAAPMRFVHMKIWCTFPLDLNVSTHYPFLPQLTMQIINFNVSGRGEFSAVMQLYKTSNYEVAYLAPPTIGTTDTLYVGVSLLETEDENTNVVIQRCWATPTRDLDHPEQYPLIKESCPVTGNLDGSIKMYGNGEERMVRWEGAVFKFIAHKEVWLHCAIKICFGDNCQPNCNRFARKRRSIDGNVIVEPRAHILSAGPIVVNNKDQIKSIPPTSPEPTTNVPQESVFMVNTMILIVVGVLSVVIIACIVVIVCVVAHFRRQKSKNKFSKTTEANTSNSTVSYNESGYAMPSSDNSGDYFEREWHQPTTTTFYPETPNFSHNNSTGPQATPYTTMVHEGPNNSPYHSTGNTNIGFNHEFDLTNST